MQIKTGRKGRWGNSVTIEGEKITFNDKGFAEIDDNFFPKCKGHGIELVSKNATKNINVDVLDDDIDDDIDDDLAGLGVKILRELAGELIETKPKLTNFDYKKAKRIELVGFLQKNRDD